MLEYSEKRKSMLDGGRVLIWFSCGATSAVAAKLAHDKYIGKKPVEILYCDTGSEPESNRVFLRDVERWIGCKIKILKNRKYKNVIDLIKKTRHINKGGIYLCTSYLKKSLRQQYEDPMSDIQVFGFDTSEIPRIERFYKANEEVYLELPLIDHGLSKDDCLAILKREGITLPEAYLPQKSGSPYKHANCIGCIKGSAKYWGKIRIDYPKVFHTMSKLEEELDQCIVKYRGQWTRLKDLPLDIADEDTSYDLECSLLCDTTLETFNKKNQ